MEVLIEPQDEAIEKIMAGMRQWTPGSSFFVCAPTPRRGSSCPPPLSSPTLAAERSEYCDTEPAHPLFMTTTPTLEDGAANPHLAALANMAYDDDETPEGSAREAKDKGNAAFQRGAAFFGHAIKHYNDAIDHIAKSTAPKYAQGWRGRGVSHSATRPRPWRRHAAEMRSLLSTVYANLAAVHLARRKYITALGACEKVGLGDEGRCGPARVGDASLRFRRR